MAYIEEKYRTVSGDEQELRRGFNCLEAEDEHEAVNFTRAQLVAAGEDFWPPLANGDYMTTTDTIPDKKFLIDVAVEEIDFPARGNAVNTFNVVARYGYRALCPIFDYNLGLQNQTVTQALDVLTDPANPNGPKLPVVEQRYVRSGDIIPFDGAIEPNDDGSSAKGTQIGVPRTSFTMTWNPYFVGATDVEVLRFAKQCHDYVGKTNAITFLSDTSQGFTGFEVGSLRFDGWTGKLIDQKNNLYEYRFEFSYNSFKTSPAAPNEDTIGGVTITGGDLYGGWKHLWIKWIPRKTATTSNKVVKPEAQQLNFETVIDQFDFYNLFRQFGSPTGTRYVSQGCPGFADFTLP